MSRRLNAAGAWWRQSAQTFATQTQEGPAMIAALWLEVVRVQNMTLWGSGRRLRPEVETSMAEC